MLTENEHAVAALIHQMYPATQITHMELGFKFGGQRDDEVFWASSAWVIGTNGDKFMVGGSPNNRMPTINLRSHPKETSGSGAEATKSEIRRFINKWLPRLEVSSRAISDTYRGCYESSLRLCKEQMLGDRSAPFRRST